jgi:type II secretory pathway pseudopilin PulG
MKGFDKRTHRARRREAGYSYVEVLVTTTLIAVVLVPALDGLSSGIQGAGIHVELIEEQSHLASGFADVLAQPFGLLDTEALTVGDPTIPTSYSDAPGTPLRRLVYLARYDGDDADGDGDRFTGGDDGLLWVRVEIENTPLSLETLTSR